ncbi:MAG: NAD(P)-dependent alcohol dehydrogenase [Spirochaetes bacterium]|nr:NAD(P)-dependent alcohol dehydrogenase [Spirochaetota bacterium]
MKAITHNTFGPPEVLGLAEVPTPEPGPGELRVRVMATTVNRTDTGFRDPQYLLVRLFSGLRRPKNPILGSEFAGVVDKVGPNATRFKEGDRVFGLRTFRFGAHAEYLCIKEDASIATMPRSASFEEAAAVCDGLMLAKNYVGRIDFARSPRLLINGGTGSIGCAALQLAKSRGAHVTVTCKTSAIGLMKELGADAVIDYTKEDFTIRGERFDVVLDAVGKSTFFRCRRILVPKGIYYSSELGPWWQNPLLALLTPLLGGRRVGFPIPTDRQSDIEMFRDLMESGKVRAVIDRVWPLADIIEATRYVETGEKTGNVVIRVA